MKFSFSDEQAEFRGMLRRFLEDKSPTTEVRRLMATESGHDPDVWRQLSQELGLTAIHIPEAYGGSDLGLAAAVTIAEPMGRQLSATPWLPSSGCGSVVICRAVSPWRASVRAWAV